MDKHTHIPLKKVTGHITWRGNSNPPKEFLDAMNRMAEVIVNLPERELLMLTRKIEFITSCIETDPRQIRKKMLRELGFAPPINEVKRILGLPENPVSPLEKQGYSFETGV